ncbi:hypothetical protein [Sulfuritalea sp.]|uniref:hypothetical protein n=1 Tax=Sulfuritalea sp. TaxID=2480090 RepID=UPI00286DD8DE|nr:hypothetical protein [Sulfuritalea sp.]
MRFLLPLLLAVLLSLNAASAAVVGVCDALEHRQSDIDASHFGHHSHQHGDDHAHDTPPADADGTGKVPAANDHHHAHVHPGFSMLLPIAVGVMPLEGRSPLVAAAANSFSSAPHVRLDRPPRAALA